jgi:hypothetical protein
MKNGAGQVFWPEFNINTIGQWNPRDGYQVNMKSAAGFAITGAQLVPEATPISMVKGWNLAAYLRNAPQEIQNALASIADKIVIIKNNAGQVYWPQFNINTIGSMQPGQGYQMNLTNAGTLLYPADSPAAGLPKAKLQSSLARRNHFATPEHFSFSVSNTGVNATLLIESAKLADGDEIAATTSGGSLVGAGTVQQGRALLAVWGDDIATKEVREGPVEGEILLLLLWTVADQKEIPLIITGLQNGLTGESLENVLRFQTDAVWVAQVTVQGEAPEEFSLAQNYPNPFNPSTRIRYGLPADAKVKLELFDLLGRRIEVLVDERQKAGYHEVTFQNSTLPSGLYFYRLKTEAFTQIRKMMILR